MNRHNTILILLELISDINLQFDIWVSANVYHIAFSFDELINLFDELRVFDNSICEGFLFTLDECKIVCDFFFSLSTFASSISDEDAKEIITNTTWASIVYRSHEVIKILKRQSVS